MAVVNANISSIDETGKDVVLQGYLKKLKTLKKKYFVLRSNSSGGSARIEYYDSEKKYKARLTPKRAILLKSCININRRPDTKHKCVIALQVTKDDCFCILYETEADLNRWLQHILTHRDDTNDNPKDANNTKDRKDNHSVLQLEKPSAGIDEPDCITRRYSVRNTQVIQEETNDEICNESERDRTDTFNDDYINTRIAGLRLSLSYTTGVSTYRGAGTSPADDCTYVQMSPGMSGTSPPRYRRSRTSSIAEDFASDFRHTSCGCASSCSSSVTDSGYVPMSGNVGVDCVEMDSARSASRASITSGTPSTDLRFSEYHLEKVTSYFAPSSDDEESSSRPIRAYSVGSRPESIMHKNHIERMAINNQSSSSRTRAFSVGSRTKLQQQKVARQNFHHVQCQHVQPHISSSGVVSNPHSRKATSAPVLSSSWSERSGRMLHGSVEPMDDLMEMDFTHSKKSSASVITSSSGINIKRRHLKDEGYVDMSSKSNNSTGYVEMKPLVSNSSLDANSSSDVVDGYMDMTPGSFTSSHSAHMLIRQKNCNMPSISQLKPNYIASPRGVSHPVIKSYSTVQRSNQLQDYVNASACGSNQENCLQPVDQSRNRLQAAPDGYVEMSWNGGKKNTKQLEVPVDDYMTMSFDNVNKRYERNMSQPINICSNHTETSKPQMGYLPVNMTAYQQRESNIALFAFSPSKLFLSNKSCNHCKYVLNNSFIDTCSLNENENQFQSSDSEQNDEVLHINCCKSNTSEIDSDYVNCKHSQRLSSPAGDYVLLLTSA